MKRHRDEEPDGCAIEKKQKPSACEDVEGPLSALLPELLSLILSDEERFTAGDLAFCVSLVSRTMAAAASDVLRIRFKRTIAEPIGRMLRIKEEEVAANPFSGLYTAHNWMKRMHRYLEVPSPSYPRQEPSSGRRLWAHFVHRAGKRIASCAVHAYADPFYVDAHEGMHMLSIALDPREENGQCKIMQHYMIEGYGTFLRNLRGMRSQAFFDEILHCRHWTTAPVGSVGNATPFHPRVEEAIKINDERVDIWWQIIQAQQGLIFPEDKESLVTRIKATLIALWTTILWHYPQAQLWLREIKVSISHCEPLV